MNKTTIGTEHRLSHFDDRFAALLPLSNSQTILVTGGAGYIGSVLVQHAVAAGFAVNILDEAQSAYSCEGTNIRFFKGSIGDRQIVEESLRGTDFIIHLAGVSDGRAGKRDPALTSRTNVKYLGNLLELSRSAGVKRFLFASTMGVYGTKYGIPLTEDLSPDPVDPYSESKAVGEEIVCRSKSDELVTSSLRIAMVYGHSPRMREDFIVNRMALDAVRTGEITISGGCQKRPQVYINDLSSIFLSFLRANERNINGECFNVVGVNPSIEDIACAVARSVPSVSIKRVPGRENEDSFEMDGRKLADRLECPQQTTMDAGINGIVTQERRNENGLD